MKIQTKWAMGQSLGIAALILGIFQPRPASALSMSWTNTAGGAWETAGNWSPNVTPHATNTLTIGSTGAYTVTMNNTTATNSAWLAASDLTLSAVGAPTLLVDITNSVLQVGTGSGSVTLGNGTLTVSNGGVSASRIIAGTAGGNFARVNIYGGTNTFSRTGGSPVFLGNANGATGQLVVAGGLLRSTTTIATGALALGTASGGLGLMTVSAGLVESDRVFVGQVGGGAGQLNIDGGTTTVTSSYLAVGELANSTGKVVMTGGLLRITNTVGGNLNVGRNGNGQFIQSNGVLSADKEVIGTLAGSSGQMTLVGGTNMVNNTFYVGDAAGSTGSVVVAGGLLWITNANTDIGVNGGKGQLTVSGGAFVSTNGLVGLRMGFAGGNGSASFNGGKSIFNALLLGNNTNAAGVAGTGTVTVAGGALVEMLGSTALGKTFGGVYGAITNRDGGTVSFLRQNNPTITINNGNFVVTNAVIEFKDASAANLLGGITNITVQANSRVQLNASTNASLASYSVGGASTYAQLGLAGGNTLWQSGALSIGSGGALLVSNATATVAAALTSTGDIRVINSRVTYQSNVVVSGLYFSDPSTNTFNTNLTVTSSGYLQGGVGDLFVFERSFINQSTQSNLYDTLNASVLFTNGGAFQHVLENTGLELGGAFSGYSNNFAIGTLTLASGDLLRITGGVSNALYIGVFDLGGGLVNTNNLTLDINVYYDPSLLGNAYLGGGTYDLTGTGMLIAIPEPSALAVLGLGIGALALVMRKRQGVHARQPQPVVYSLKT